MADSALTGGSPAPPDALKADDDIETSHCETGVVAIAGGSAGRKSSTSRSSPSSSAWSGLSSTRRHSPPPRPSLIPLARDVAVAPRIAENGRLLLDAYRVLARATKDERSITPAAEWLVDNFPIVDEQLREIRDDLPPTTTASSPSSPRANLAGYPRVLGLAWAYVAHTDSRLDPETLLRMSPRLPGRGAADDRRAVGDSRSASGSSWSRTSAASRSRSCEAARLGSGRDELADGLLGLGTDSPELAATALRRLSAGALPTAARVQLFQPPAGDQDPAVTPALHWLEELLATQGTTTEEIVRLEHQRQATMNVNRPQRDHEHAPSSRGSTGPSSSRASAWSTKVFRARSSFEDMDFATRDRYRTPSRS